jgi:hypothetical protein
MDLTGLNFNTIMWEAPEHDGDYGFIPGDKYYDEVVAWLRSLTFRYVANGTKKISKRLSIPNSDYDVLASWDRETGLINYVFMRRSSYSV